MKLVNKNDSTQVLTDAGRLVIAYGSEAEAKAYVLGYSTAQSDFADLVSLRAAEIVREIGGKA